MSQSLLDTITPILQDQGLSCVRTGKGRDSQFWGKDYGDLLTIRVQADSVALCWTITFTDPKEKSHPWVFKQASSLEEFLKVKEDWIARVMAGF